MNTDRKYDENKTCDHILDTADMNKQMKDCDMTARDAGDAEDTENHCKIQVKYKSGSKPANG